jgi:hypothetical protein
MRVNVTTQCHPEAVGRQKDVAAGLRFASEGGTLSCYGLCKYGEQLAHRSAVLIRQRSSIARDSGQAKTKCQHQGQRQSAPENQPMNQRCGYLRGVARAHELYTKHEAARREGEHQNQ